VYMLKILLAASSVVASNDN